MEIKFKLDIILQERKISARKLAADSGVNYRTILNIYHNYSNGISLPVLASICQALEIMPGDLLDVDEVGQLNQNPAP